MDELNVRKTELQAPSAYKQSLNIFEVLRS